MAVILSSPSECFDTSEISRFMGSLHETIFMFMECRDKIRLLRRYIDSNYEYRLALERCRACRACSRKSPGTPIVCQLDQFMTRADQALEAVTRHLNEHGCERVASPADAA